jgi:transcription initiation factor TFIIIB Brf1 subunit/transcription initiation factor TFIIB
MYTCTYCGENELSKFQFDDFNNERGSDNYVCTSCGTVLPELTSKQLVKAREENLVGEVKTPAPFLDTYDPFVHASERIKQTQYQEPKISDQNHISTITEAHHQLCKRDFFYRLRTKQGHVNKKTVQSLLRFVDRKRHKEGKKKKFCKLYLGKKKKQIKPFFFNFFR